MAIVWFLLGFAVGCGLWIAYSRRLNRRVAEMLQQLSDEAVPTQSASLARLHRLLNQHRTAQRDLQRQVAMWKEIVQAAPIGYLEIDGMDQLLWYNDKACRLLKIELPCQVVSGRLLLQVVRSLDLEQLVKDVRQAQQSSYRDWVMYVISPNGSPAQDLPLRGYGIPLPNGRIGVFIEDRQEATALVAERDRWASDVAHELKTPLTSIRLMVETLHDQVDPSLQNWTLRLLQEAARLSNLVQDVLELSRVSDPHPENLCLSEVDLPALVRSAWLNLEPLAQQKNLALYYEGPEHLILQADETRLYRVLMNVIDNGIKHSPVDQALLIEVSTETVTQDGIIVDVIDSGAGFPNTALAHVFKRFFRADPSRVRVQETGMNMTNAEAAVSTGSGSGLGLAIVERIVVAHGGWVEAQNHPQTGGGWLRIWLPQSP